jgi:hypothetical protein
MEAGRLDGPGGRNGPEPGAIAGHVCPAGSFPAFANLPRLEAVPEDLADGTLWTSCPSADLAWAGSRGFHHCELSA